jgi:kinesin family protein 6/9
MNGDTQNYDHRGLAPRAISQIFSEVSSRIEYEFKVSCSYIEIYNERIFDLLDDLSGPDQVRDYKREKVTEVEIQSESEALNVLFTGELARTTATHRLNRKSNRSHSLFTVYLEQRQRSGISERVVHSKLVLTDLAGSERLKKTMNSEDGYSTADDAIRKESMCINQSLTYLEQCIVALSRKGQNYIPFRQSKLTTILKDCLGSNCNTVMIACIWGEEVHLEETISTLRLASRMMRVENETSVTESVDPDALIRKQDRLIRALKQELLMHDALVERTGVVYDPFTPEQQASIVSMIERFIDAREEHEEDTLQISSVRQMLEVCKQFKRLLLSSKAEVELVREEAQNYALGGTFQTSRGGDKGIETSFSADTKIADEYDPRKQSYVGVPEGNRLGFSLGQAPSQSRPVTIEAFGSPISKYTVGSPNKTIKESFKSPASPKSFGRIDFNLGNLSPELSRDDQGIMFETYISNEGIEEHGAFVDAKALVRDLKTRAREASAAVNLSKVSIDDLQRKMELRKESRIELLKRSGFRASEAEEIVDEEELTLMRDLKEAKRSYKSSYESFQRNKNNLTEALIRVENAKNALGTGFLAWSYAHSGDVDYYPESTGENSDILDNQESFDKMEAQRVQAMHPGKNIPLKLYRSTYLFVDSLPFFNAQKTRKALLNQNGSSIRQAQKSKRQIS